MKWMPTVAASLSLTIPLGVASSVQAVQVLAGPTNGQFTIGSLPNGNYRFCADRPPSGIDRENGPCFRFRKVGEDIVGEYYYPYKGSTVCLTGQVNNNTVTGQGLEPLPASGDARFDSLPGSELVAWETEGNLQVRRATRLGTDTGRDRIRYRSALLNLNGFYQYNAGTVLPPQNCFNVVARTPQPEPDDSTTSEPPANQSPPEPSDRASSDNFIPVGDSAYYSQPIYLDRGSIESAGTEAYQYTTVVGLDSRDAETDYTVDCDNLYRVRVLRSRYYDEQGAISEVEPIDREQTVSPNDLTAPQYRANQIVCDQPGEGTAPTTNIPAPQNVSYARYVNERFNFSVQYPENILMPQPPPTNLDGRTFTSRDSRITMRVYGQNNALSRTLAERYQEALQEQSGTITYRNQGDNWFIISGYRAGDVFYTKTILENNNFKTLSLVYDRDLQAEFDPIVAEISRSFDG